MSKSILRNIMPVLSAMNSLCELNKRILEEVNISYTWNKFASKACEAA